MCLRHFRINSKMILDMCFNLMSSTSSQDIQLCSSIEKDTAFKLIEISKEPLKLFWMRENREEGKSFQRMGLLLEGAYQWEMGFWLLFHFSGHFPKRIPQEFFKVPELGQFKIIKRFQLLVPKSQAKWFEFQVYKNCFWFLTLLIASWEMHYTIWSIYCLIRAYFNLRLAIFATWAIQINNWLFQFDESLTWKMKIHSFLKHSKIMPKHFCSILTLLSMKKKSIGISNCMVMVQRCAKAKKCET